MKKSGIAKFFALVKKELYSYAINPFYYIAGIVFCLFCSAGFFIMGRFFVDGRKTAALSRFFLLMPYILSVLLPTLCLNIKNRAFDKSLAFSERSLLLSRVLAALAVFALYALPTLAVPLCVGFFSDVDLGALFTAYLGILFFALAAISLCVFLSELIQNRAAFFACSVLLLSAINLAHFLPLAANLGETVSAIVRNISFAWHFDSAGKGVFDTRDFVFYIVVSLAFVGGAVLAIEAGKGRRFSKKDALNIAVFCLALVFALLDSGRIYKRIDLSKTKQYSISKYTRDLISSAEEKIRVTYYRSNELIELYPQVRDVSYFLQSLALENKISYTELEPVRRGEEKNLIDLGVRPYQIQSVKNNRTEYIDTFSAVSIEYLGSTQIIPLVLSSASLEFDIAIRLDYLLNKTQRKIHLLAGNGLSLEKDYSVSAKWLNLEGFETNELVLPLDATSLQDTSGALLLYGTSALSIEDAAIIEDFILRGGAAVVMTSPYSINIAGGWEATQNEADAFIPILEKWGAGFSQTLAADVSNVRASFYSAQGEGAQYQYVNYPLWINVLPSSSAKADAPAGLEVFWASPIEILDEEKAMPIFETSGEAWRLFPDEQNLNLNSSLFYTNPFSTPKSAAEASAKKERSILGARIIGEATGLYTTLSNPSPRVTVISGEHFANDLILSLAGGEAGDYRNLAFLSGEIFKMRGENELASLKNSGAGEAGLYKITAEDEAQRAIIKTFLINFLLVPVLILLFMAVIFMRRRRLAKLSARAFAVKKQNGGEKSAR